MRRPTGRRALVLVAAVAALAALAAPSAAMAAPAQNPVPVVPDPAAANPVPPVTPPADPAAQAAAQAAQQAAAQLAAQQAAAEQAAAQQAAQLAAQQAAQAEAARKAAEAAAKARAAAAKLAAQTAAAAQRATAAWTKRGRPDKLVIVHQTSIDTVEQGRLLDHQLRSGTALSLAGLDAALPASWLTTDGTTARLAAAVIMTPGTTLDVTGVTTLRLVGGAKTSDAAFLDTGGGHIRLSGVTVTSVDAGADGPVAPTAAGRPYLIAATQGRLDLTDATVSDLGTQPAGDAKAVPAVRFGTGSSGSVTRTTLSNDSIGLELSGSQGVALQDVTVSGAAGEGLVLSGDRGTTLAGIKAEHNGGNGVLVTGAASDRTITGIATTGNRAYGVAVNGLAGVAITGLTLRGDQAGGLELNRVTGATVRDVTTTDEPNGVFLHVFSTGVTLDGLRAMGGRTGVQVEKTTKGLRLTRSTLEGSAVSGISVGGHDTTLTDVTVTGARTGVRVERGAGGVTATGLALVGGQDGVVTSGGTSGVVLKDLSADGVATAAVRNLSAGMQIIGGRVRGSRTGIDLQAATTMAGTAIGLAETGIRVRTPAAITMTNVTVDAVSVGLDIAAGSAVTLRDSVVHALQSVRGTLTALGRNDMSLPPLNLLGAIGVPLLLLAIALEAAHFARTRAHRRAAGGRRSMPPPVLVGAR